MPLGTEVGLGTGDIVLDGDTASPKRKRGQQPPSFRPMSLVAKQSPISVTAELLYKPDQSIDADSDSSCAASAAYSINNLSAAPHASLTVQLSTPDREHCQSVVAALTGITSNAADRRKFTQRLPRPIIDDQSTNGRHAAHRQRDRQLIGSAEDWSTSTRETGILNTMIRRHADHHQNAASLRRNRALTRCYAARPTLRLTVAYGPSSIYTIHATCMMPQQLRHQ